MQHAEQSDLSPIVHRFIQDAGNLTQSFGVGRVLGQIYAYVYFSPTPRNLLDMQKALGISKGSASTGVRQLEQWGAVRKVWIKGDRKDYYCPSEWFGIALKNAIWDTMGKKMAAYTNLLNEIEKSLADVKDGEDGAFLRDRIQLLRGFQERAQAIWGSPIVKMLLKR